MTRIALSPVIDRGAVARHLAELQAAFAAGGAVEIGCDQVEQIGQAGLQLLASAVRTSAARGVALSFAGGGGALEAATRLAGMSEIIFGPVTPAGASA